MHALHEVLHAFFNLHSFTLAMPDVWAGFQVNLKMMVIAEVLVLVLALAIAIVRGLSRRAARPSGTSACQGPSSRWQRKSTIAAAGAWR